jgi:hypothetical protein
MMDNSKIFIWVGCFIVSIVIWRLVHFLLAILDSSGQLLVFAPWLVLVISTVLMCEVVGKIAILSVLSPKQHIATAAQDWPDIDHHKLEDYTLSLKDLGFKPVLDFTYEKEDYMLRLFMHPQEACLAEVGQLKNQPMAVHFMTVWEQGWALGVGNSARNPKNEVLRRELLSQPGDIIKNMQNASVEQMYAEFISMRNRVNSHLQIQPMLLKSIDDYFEFLEQRQAVQRKALLWKSILLVQIKLQFAARNSSPAYFGKAVVKAGVFAN